MNNPCDNGIPFSNNKQETFYEEFKKKSLYVVEFSANFQMSIF